MSVCDESSTSSAPTALKLLVAGGFGVGKTTLVGAVSEIRPLTTEELLTTASSRTDSLTGVEAKTTTTVSMDFGRITINVPRRMVLYLFGTPGQDRFLFTWDDLADGAIGAIVLVDTRRLADGFTALGYFEKTRMPFVVAVNEFADARHRYHPDEVREALDLSDKVPVLLCDARDPRCAVDVLLALVDHARALARSAHPQSPLGAHT